jgi:hypothetical protein
METHMSANVYTYRRRRFRLLRIAPIFRIPPDSKVKVRRGRDSNT